MPKKISDYSKTIIYKICCNDININECYVGHTTNFIKRKNYHKISCNNPNDKNHYNNKVYQFIRNSGGWDNWSIIPVEEFPCENVIQAIIRERYWYEKINATLNTDKPHRNSREYYEDNKEIIKEKNKKYIDNNKEKIQLYKKDLYDKQKEDLKKKVNCICGSIICNYSYNLHLKSKKHINYLQMISLNQ
jgi:hypothetical protein